MSKRITRVKIFDEPNAKQRLTNKEFEEYWENYTSSEEEPFQDSGSKYIESESSNSDKTSDAEDDSNIEDEEELVNEHTTLPTNRDWNTCTLNTTGKRTHYFTYEQRLEYMHVEYEEYYVYWI
ncbi:hypothetical protein QE152_g13289 [Popillia japonica]|uniref:Uncharacterized protein n=1 Tax=Popillia japonica TaxID=7064 RepID=A0AAW1LDM7_POPJA